MPGTDRQRRIGERLLHVFGGRHVSLDPNRKPPRLSGPTAPPVTGYYAWFDAADVASVTHVSGRVTAWNDKSGNGSHGTASGNPTLIFPAPTGAGRPAVWFDSTYNLTSAAGMSDQTSSGFCVAMMPSIAAIRPMFGPSNDGGIELRTETTGKITVNKSDNALLGTNDANPVTAGVPFVASYRLSASDVVIGNNLNFETDAHAQSLTAARTLVIGRVPNTGTPLQLLGWIGEIILYPTTLSLGDAEAVIGYLMSKWGIS